MIGSSNEDRSTTMEVDWVFFHKDEEISPTEIDNYINDFREQGVIRINLEGAIEYTSVTPATQTPFQGILSIIPGVVQAENYDEGGEGVAFHDIDQVNEGKAYRTDGVDIETNGHGGFNVGYIAINEWLEYTINVTQNANYLITCKVANNGETAGEFDLEIDGKKIGETAVVVNNGSWSEWLPVNLGSTYLTEGEHTLRLIANKESFNIDEIEFVTATNTGENLSETKNKTIIFPNPASDIVYFKSPKDIINVDLLNMQYQKLKTTQENKISIEDLDAGVYLLKIQFNDYAVYKKLFKSK